MDDAVKELKGGSGAVVCSCILMSVLLIDGVTVAIDQSAVL